MPAKKPVAKKGFLNAWEVSERARKKGFMVKPKTLTSEARAGKIPYSEKIPGKQKGMQFREDKLDKIIGAVPKKSVVPKGKMTTAQIQTAAKKRGIPLNLDQINQFIAKRIKANDAAGLERDEIHTRKRFFVPKKMAEEIITEARHRKNLPKMLERKQLVPLKALAGELGITPTALFRYISPKQLKTFTVSGRIYVARSEQSRFKQWYKENIEGTASSMGGRLRLALPQQRQGQKKMVKAKKRAPGPPKPESEPGLFAQVASIRAADPEQRASLRLSLAEKIRAGEEQLTESKGKLFQKREKSGKGFTVPQLLELTRIDLQLARLDLSKALLDGESPKSPKCKRLVQRITDFQQKASQLENRQ